jgi:hypothetical protein
VNAPALVVAVPEAATLAPKLLFIGPMAFVTERVWVWLTMVGCCACSAQAPTASVSRRYESNGVSDRLKQREFEQTRAKA